MHPVSFPGAIQIGKPANMTDEQCMSAWAKYGFEEIFRIIKMGAKLPPAVFAGIDIENFPYYMTAWQPNKEDIEAINRGEPIYVKVIATALPPMALFTLDENKDGNF